MMRVFVLRMILLACSLSAAGILSAQDRDGPRERLQAQVMERFMENYRSQAGLTDQQFTQFRDLARQAFEERTEFNRRERALWRALEGQMRPGIAADADSLTALLDRLVNLQDERVQRARSEQQQFAQFLSPVQRAQLTLAIRRLQNQVERLIQQRLQGRDVPRRQ